MTRTNWTSEQIMALAPDDASGKAGRGLATVNKWVSLAHNEERRAVWGECQGSGSKPYQVQIDLSEPAFRCSCPSRKFPCKHGIGLFLLYAASQDKQNNTVPVADPPAWVTEWLEKRQATAEKAQQKREERANEDEATAEARKEKAAKDQARRAASREAKVTQGLQDLKLWMCDIVRQGLSTLPARSPQCWDEQAARMVDAQAPGIARALREMGSIPNSGEGWHERLLERLGLLHLLLEGYSRIDSPHLTDGQRADIRDGIGWTVRQEEVLAQGAEKRVADQWLVIGIHSYQEEQFKVQRTWLQGKKSERMALLLDFIRQGQPPAQLCMLDTRFEAELAFYPGAYPLRALIERQLSAPVPASYMAGYPTASAMLDAYANALAKNPWLDPFPAPLVNMIPCRIATAKGDRWALRDTDGHLLPIRSDFHAPYTIMAASGGHPIGVFGEWNEEGFLPLNSIFVPDF